VVRALPRCAIVVALLTPVCGAATYYVNAASGNDAWNGLCREWNGGTCGPKATIQAALNLTVDGDSVVVADGTYTGPGNRDLSLLGNAVTVRSENGPDHCLIDCGNAGSGFKLSTAETAASIIDGFTITNGNAVFGGGVRCDFAHPTIQNCTITGNWASAQGGGIFCWGSHPTLRACRISGNTATGSGGGVYGYISSAALIDCTVTANTAAGSGGGLCFLYNNPTVVNCTVTGNKATQYGGGVYSAFSGAALTNCLIAGNSASNGGGVQLHNSYATVTNCAISGNRAASGGGGIGSAAAGNSGIHNCILWVNAAPQGPEITVGSGVTLRVAYSDVLGGEAGVYVASNGTLLWGSGNIDADPLFLAPGHWDDAGTPGNPADDFWVDGDYHLHGGSPGMDAADNGAVPPDWFDLNGNGDTSEPLPVDRDGGARFVDDPDTPDTGSGAPPIVDMGLYEFADCNHNGIPDIVDIAQGTSLDENHNGIPDDCEPKLKQIPTAACSSQTLTLKVGMSGVQQLIVGGQFFLKYDTNKLDFVSVDPGDASGTDPDNPFEREICEVVDRNGGEIDYAVGIPDGAAGTSNSVALAVVTFTVKTDDCQGAGLVQFRAHYPVTRLSGELGAPVVPELTDLPTTTLDATPPDLTVPPDVTVPWNAPTDPAHTGQATATDNCDPAPLITYEDEQQGNQILRTWTATDACDNSVQGVQTITLRLGPLGDLNCDGQLNAFDIDPFVLALTDPNGYAAAYPDCDRVLADCNCDGSVDAFDIDPFVQCLTVGCPECP
jgi:hypothetical protein